jgi:hypothetical protein
MSFWSKLWNVAKPILSNVAKTLVPIATKALDVTFTGGAPVFSTLGSAITNMLTP